MRLFTPVPESAGTKESGTKRHRRPICYGKALRAVLYYMAAVSGSRATRRHAAFYRRLVAASKPPKPANPR